MDHHRVACRYGGGVGTVELLLHPVRLRIVQAFLGDRALTTAALRAELDAVPTASLYRHVAILVEAGVLDVTNERKARGAVERTYVLRLDAAQLSAEDIVAMQPRDHHEAIVGVIAGLLREADRYLATEGIDPLRDGLGYRMLALWLDEAEVQDLAVAMAEVLQPRLANGPRPGRHRRLLWSFSVPGVDP